MSKNMTRKGLAFGAGFALVASGLVASPAQAAGMDTGFVSLLPGVGAEYDVLAGSDFQLKSDLAAGIVGSAGTLKFQITDSAAKTTVVQSGNTTQTIDNTGDTVNKTAAGVVTIAGLGTGHGYAEGEEISVSGIGNGFEATSGLGSASLTVTQDGVTAISESFTITIASATAADTETITVTNAATGAVTLTLTGNEANGANDAANDIEIADKLEIALDGAAGILYDVARVGAVLTLTAKTPGVKTDVTVADTIGGAANRGTITQGVDAAVESVTLTLNGTPALGDRITVANVADAAVIYTVTAADVAGANAAADLSLIRASLVTAITGATGAKYNDNTSTAADVKLVAKTAGANTNVAATHTGELIILDTERVTVTGSSTNAITFAAGVTEFAMTQLTGKTVVLTLLETSPVAGVKVFDTKLNTAPTKLMTLSSTDLDETQTVQVVAWLDSNSNGEIDSTEYVSPTRTVRFLASAEVTPTLTWQPISVGDTTVKADITFSPVLNGSQLSSALNLSSANAAVKVAFERPGSSVVVDDNTVTYSNTTKKWTATSQNMNASAWDIADAADYNGAATYAITSNVITITTATAHGYQVGDRVVITSSATRTLSPTTAGKAFSTITSVPSTTSFTYAEQSATGVVATTGVDVAASTDAETPAINATTGESKIVRDFAVTGNYFGQVYLYKYGTADALTKIGAKVSSAVGATVASSATKAPTFSGVPSETVSATGAVKTGTTAAGFVLSVFDKKGDPVGAGVSATITTTTVTSAGTVKVNGTTVTSGSALVTQTDANGQVAISLTNSSGAAGNSVVMNATVQNVAATTFTATWANASYSIYDTADTSTSSANRNRAVAEGGSYTFNLRVLDQWNAPLDGATHRLLVAATQNSVVASTQTVALSAGAATVTVADAGQDGDTSASVTVQKLVAGVWTSQTTNSDVYADWAGAGSGDLAPVLLKYYDQTDAITLNADGASLPSGTLSELDANVTTVALKSADTRFSNESPNTYPAATKAVVGGKVTNANTGVSKSGAVVTVSAPGVLFNNGGVWAIGSINVLSNDGTFSVDSYSRVAGEIKVTVTHGAVSKDVTVDFNAVGTVAGYSIELSAPASVQAGSTFRVQGQIKDVNGNGVPLLTAGTGTNPTLKVAYQGLGLVSGSLPTTTDASGNFYFYVLVGSNDKGTGTVTVSYDIDGTSTTNAAVAKSQTIYVGQSAPGDTKVNAGSFKGFVAVYAKGYEGKRMSAKIGNDWVVVNSLASNFERVTDFTGAGVNISVRIFIDRVLVGTFPLVTK